MCCAAASAFAQPPSATGPPTQQPLCRAADALTRFATTARHVLRGRAPQTAWSVFQVPCETLADISDLAGSPVLIVDPSFASDQEVLSYGFTSFEFSPRTPVVPQPDDPFARLGRLILKPTLSAVPTVWTRSPLAAGPADALRLAAAAGAVSALAEFRGTLCSDGPPNVPGALLEVAEAQSRHHTDYHLFFDAALQEHRAIRGPRTPLTSVAARVAEAMRGMTVPGLRCDLGNRDRFSLRPFGPGTTSLARAADHIERAHAGVRRNGRSDLGQLNLARACIVEAINEMVRANRAPSCDAQDYGLWSRAYAPLLHAAQVKVLETSR